VGYSFISPDREQGYLMPPDLREWLPEDDLARVVVDVVASLDLMAFYAPYRADGWGHPAFHPEMMVSLLVYAYCVGERSSRQIERLCQRDIAFRYIMGNRVPDHTTIARFRQEHEETLATLFTQVLRLCREAGLVKVGVVAVDGTKVKANAALAANWSREQIERGVRRMLAEAKATDEEEDAAYGPERRGDELPEELRDPGSRRARLEAARQRLAHQEEEVQRAQAERLEERRAEEQATGQKKRGRKPRAPEEVAPKGIKANVTDPESRIMKTWQGYVQGYNAQAAVAVGQIIVAADVTEEANDVRQLHPLLAQVQQGLQGAGVEELVGSALFDAGYWSEANLAQARADGPEVLVATTKDWKQRKALRERGCPRGRIPKGLSLKERMERKLLTKRGRALYRLRSQLAEPPFGQIKDGRGFDRFLRRGKQAARSEWRLICATHNLLKLFRSNQGAPRTQGRRRESSPWASASQALAA
jgi:transposase